MSKDTSVNKRKRSSSKQTYNKEMMRRSDFKRDQENARLRALVAQLREALRPLLERGDAGHTDDGCAPMYGCHCGLLDEWRAGQAALAAGNEDPPAP